MDGLYTPPTPLPTRVAIPEAPASTGRVVDGIEPQDNKEIF